MEEKGRGQGKGSRRNLIFWISELKPEQNLQGPQLSDTCAPGTSQRCASPGSAQFSSVQSLSRVWLFATPWTAACQTSLSITNSWSLPKLMSIELVIPSNHLILYHPLRLPPSIFPSIRVFSKESALRIRCPKYWSFSFSISPSDEYLGLISFRMDWLDLLAVQGWRRQWHPTPVLLLGKSYGPRSLVGCSPRGR